MDLLQCFPVGYDLETHQYLEKKNPKTLYAVIIKSRGPIFITGQGSNTEFYFMFLFSFDCISFFDTLDVSCMSLCL